MDCCQHMGCLHLLRCTLEVNGAPFAIGEIDFGTSKFKILTLPTNLFLVSAIEGNVGPDILSQPLASLEVIGGPVTFS